jgi:diamine N-acetyltransferase
MNTSSDSDLVITTAEPEQTDILARLAVATFRQAYARQTKAEDLDLYIESALHPEKIRAQLRDPCITFLLARLNAEPAGFAKLEVRKPPDCVSDSGAVELGSLYVLKDHYGRGVGRALLAAAFREARCLGCNTLWLSVWEKNTRALKFYRRQGFAAVGRWIFWVGTDPQQDLILVRSLSP